MLTNNPRANKKAELEQKAYERAKNLKTDIPVKEYMELIILKKQYGIPLTEAQHGFLQTAESNA